MLLKMSPRLYYCHVEAVNQLRRNAPSDTSQENGTIGTKVSANRCLARTSKVYLNLSFEILNLFRERERMMILGREDTAVETTIVGERSR